MIGISRETQRSGSECGAGLIFDFVPFDVQWHVEYHWTMFGMSAPHSCGNVLSNCLNITHGLKTSTGRGHQCMLIEVLKVLFILNGSVAGHQDHWCSVFHTLHQSRDGICQTRTVSHGSYAKPSGCLCPAFGHAYRVCFVGSSHQVDPMLTFQAFADEKIAVAENGEDGVDPMVDKGLSYCIVSQHSWSPYFWN